MAANGPLAMEVRDLRRAFGGRAALQGVTFDVRPGELFGVLASNGGGKTTLCRILATALVPTSGVVRVLGHELPGAAAAVREAVGSVFAAPALDRLLTVRENLVHHGRLYGLRGRALADRIAACLDLGGAAECAGDVVGRLSLRLVRLAELAKAIVPGPGLLVLDAPTFGLDAGARRDFLDRLAAIRERLGAASLLATPFVKVAERCDRVAMLGGGRVVAAGTPAELCASVGGEVVTAVPRVAARLTSLKTAIERCFHVEASTVDGTVRIVARDGASLAHDLFRGFAQDLASVAVGRPGLEDVYLLRTGKAFA